MFNIQPLIKQYKKITDFVSFDVETTGFCPYLGDRIFSFCSGNEKFCIVARIDKPYYTMCKTDYILECINSDKNIFDKIEIRKSSIESNFYLLKSILTKAYRNTGIIIHNCKFEKGFCKLHGIEFPEDLIVHDTMLQSRELDNQSPSHGLDRLCYKLGADPLGKMADCDKRVEEEDKKLGGYQFINVNLMTEYQLYDAIRPLLLHSVFWPEILKSEKLTEDYIWEVKTALDTQEIEEAGVPIHRENCENLIKKLDKEIEAMQHESFNILEEYINLSSDDQIRRILFNKLQFPIVAFSENGTPKTDKDTIFKLKETINHPILDLIIKWRSYTDGKGNVESYLKLADEKGNVHTTLNTCQARTHRQSSSKPPMHGVSKEEAMKNPFPVAARQCFQCPENAILFLPDYSGIEMRLIAEASGEEELIKMFLDDPINADPHTIAAELFYGDLFTDQEQCFDFFINKDPLNKSVISKICNDAAYKKFRKIMRGSAKNASFAKAYIANLKRVADTLLLTVDQAEQGYWRYKARWPKVFDYSKNVAHEAKEQGFVETPFGVKMSAPRDQLYILGNYKIQHMAAKILKRGIVRCTDYFHKEFNSEVKIILDIHDELIISFPRKFMSRRQEFISNVTQIMTECKEIRVPLSVEFKITTTTWDKARKVEFK